MPPATLVVLGTLTGHRLIIVLITGGETHASIVRQRVSPGRRGHVPAEIQRVFRLFVGDEKPFVVDEARLIGEVFHVDVQTIFVLVGQGVDLLVSKPEVSRQVAEATLVRGPGDEEVRLLREITTTLNDRPSTSIGVHVTQDTKRFRTGPRPGGEEHTSIADKHVLLLPDLVNPTGSFSCQVDFTAISKGVFTCTTQSTVGYGT